MNIFLDFEATQWGNYMISIGAVAENGKSFYSLINPGSKPRKKITNFITDLTGITKEMCAVAEDTDTVMIKFFNWCFSLGDPELHFFCYGNCDLLYIKTAYGRVQDIKAKFITKYMEKHLTDYSVNVKEHLELESEIKLIKVASYYQNKLLTQNHNALDDAILLKSVFDGAESSMEDDKEAFQRYLEQLKSNTKEI